MNFFATLAAALLTPFSQFSTQMSAVLTAAALPMVLAGLTINLVWQGLSVLRGAGGQHVFLDLFAINFRAILVVLLAIGTGTGYQNIVAMLTELQTGLLGMSARGADVSSAPALLDTQLQQLLLAYRTLLKAGFDQISISPLAANFTGLEIILCASVIALAMLLFVSFAFVEIVAVQGAISMMAAIGPLFVAAAAFRATSSYFSGWLNGMLRYTLEIVLMLVLLGVGMQATGTLLNHLVGDLNGGILTTQLDLVTVMAESIGISLVLIYLTLKISSIAASAFGGASISGAAVALGIAAATLASGAARAAAGSAGGASGGSGAGGPSQKPSGGGGASNHADPQRGLGSIGPAHSGSGLDSLGADWTGVTTRPTEPTT